MGTVRELRDFLEDAELGHYHSAITNELKITTIPQLKYVEEDDLIGIGMTKPEMRRMKKLYKREFPQGALGKLKKAILTRSGSDVVERRGLSPSPPENRNTRPPSVIRPPGKQIIPADSISSNKTLGEGEFGVVQQGIWTTETGEKVQVAIKCLSKERLQNGTTEFLKEAAIMQTIDHENIVRMFGVVLDNDNSLALVTELAPMRSLLECLKETSLRFDFTIPRLCDFAQEICDGMSYLESKRLIHRDLAARNILVFSKSKVKISDFGLSRALGVGKDYYQSNFSINLKLPIAWCAPECINYLKFTSASDVWAFGVTLWELFTYGFQPWAGLTGQQILEAIDSPNNQRLERPDLCTKEFYSLMLKCWDKEPQNRPTFSEMFVMLPQLRPSQVKTVKDFPEITVPRDFLYYKSYDLITVIDKHPENAPKPGLWKGVLSNGKSGLFDPVNCVPFLDPRTSPVSKANIVRKDSKRNSARKIRADMISGPQNDLRHTGHIGYDGAVFGDISFIGDNYDKLPVKVGKLGDQASTSSVSLTRQSPDRDSSHSDYPVNGGPTTNGLTHSWISQESIDSHCVVRDDVDGGERTPHYQDIDDDSIFADFKMPDMSGSFDFGPSFMDEVLKALDEKEAKLEASSSDASTPSKEESDLVKNNIDDRGGSLSPPVYREARRPPLPTQPPRTEPRREPPKPEVRKQAKVKPMSASDEKMIDDAIALANEVAVHSNKSHMFQESTTPPTSPTIDKRRSDSESGSESPKLITKLKMSIKRSPKQERKRTFSEEIANKAEMEEDVPPQAQEAYNLLVVRGSLKEKEKSHIPDRDFRSERKRSPESQIGVPLANTAEVFIEYDTQLVESKPVPKPRTDIKRSEIPVPLPKPRPEIIHRVEPVIRPQCPPPQVPAENDNVFYRYAEKEESPKIIEDTNTSFESDSDFDDSKRNIEVLRIDLPDSDELKKDSATDSPRSSFSQDSSKSDRSLKDSVNTSTKGSSLLFDDEFSEPSPREIMSKLARESRIRRSLDHQRGFTGGGGEISEPVPARNLREPQGIPGKSMSTSNDDDEVDTNPLRMLRGGAIPIRGGRVGQGMSSRPLKLRTKIPTLHHSMSVDSGSRANEHAIEGVNFVHDHHDDIPLTAPAVPPRSYSTSESNPVPLPPRNPHRAGTLNAKPRERKHPLVLDENPGRTSSNSAINSAATNVAWSSNSQAEHEQCPELPPAPPTPIKTSMPSLNYLEDDSVFEYSDEKIESKRPDCFPNNQLLNGNSNKSSTFPRSKFPLMNVNCDLEQIGFYNSHDPFWVKTLTLAGRNISDRGSSEEISPLMLANYKTSDGVSYEDLLDLALDREKNCAEIEAMQQVFGNEISVPDCMKALEDTKWDVAKAVKFVKLKQLLGTQLGDINICKEALMRTDWDVERAANYLLSHPLASPECVDV